jgi:serine/threonine protein kinase
MSASQDNDSTQLMTGPQTAWQTSSPVPPAVLDHDDQNALALGTRLSEFEIVGKVAEGGFGIVYLAQDHSLQRRVALKEYMPSALAMRKGGTVSVVPRSEKQRETFEVGLRSFVNEARLLAKFDHPAMVKVFRFWEQNGTAYMVMPFYEGQTLKDAVRAMPDKPDEAWLKNILAPLTEALLLIHREQCYHRDIAPDNIILLKDSGQPVLLDFGAARRVISDMTQALTVILKPGYAPVEQYAEVPDMKQGPWTDVYALAATVYWCITGKTPPPSVGRMLRDNFEIPSAVAAGRYSHTFLQALDRALVVHPEQRTLDMAYFRHELLGTPPPADYRMATGSLSPPPVAAGNDAPTLIMPGKSVPDSPQAATTFDAVVPTARHTPLPVPEQAQKDLQATEAPSKASVPHRSLWLAVAGASGVVVMLGALALWNSLQDPEAQAQAVAQSVQLSPPVEASGPSMATKPAAAESVAAQQQPEALPPLINPPVETAAPPAAQAPIPAEPPKTEVAAVRTPSAQGLPPDAAGHSRPARPPREAAPEARIEEPRRSSRQETAPPADAGLTPTNQKLLGTFLREADSAYRRGDTDGARSYAQSALRLSPKNPEALALLSKLPP